MCKKAVHVKTPGMCGPMPTASFSYGPNYRRNM